MTATPVERTARRRVPRSRLAVGALGLLALLAGLWAALLMLGLPVPAPRPDFAEVHGPLMVLGFLGTLIALERAVAIDEPAGYLAPAAAGLGGLALSLGLRLRVGQTLLAAAGIGLVGLYVAAARRQASLHLAVMAAGAVAWVVAVGLWLAGWDVALLVPWLAGFLVLTIAGERLELARVVRVTGTARVTFTAAGALFAVGLVISLTHVSTGVRVAGAGTARAAPAGWPGTTWPGAPYGQPGLTRYMAVCLLAGYGWLATAGVLWLRFGTLSDGPAFDAQLHALFLGFVIGMVFAHAPVIVPAVFRAAVPYHPHFYGHVLLLHASLLLRLLGGDLAGSRPAWQVGGVLNEVALLCFIGVTVSAVVEGRRQRRTTPSAPAPAAPRRRDIHERTPLMTYVIAEPCVDVKDRACVEECPVDCIYEGERALYIHPDECVDCGACEPVCPVEAIFYEDDVPSPVGRLHGGQRAVLHRRPARPRGTTRLARRRREARAARRRHPARRRAATTDRGLADAHPRAAHHPTDRGDDHRAAARGHRPGARHQHRRPRAAARRRRRTRRRRPGRHHAHHARLPPRPLHHRADPGGRPPRRHGHPTSTWRWSGHRPGTPTAT